MAGPTGPETLLALVGGLARMKDSEVTLLHAVPFPLVADPVTGYSPAALKPFSIPEIPWMDAAAALLQKHRIRARSLVRLGEAADVILRESRSLDIDLISMRPSGRAGLARLILGSVTREVLRRSNCSLLLHPR